jgi:hypothetical protein
VKFGKSKRRLVVFGESRSAGRLIVYLLMLAAVGAYFVYLRARSREMVVPPAPPVVTTMTEAPTPVESDDFRKADLPSPDQERELLARVQDQFPLSVKEQKEAYYLLLKKARVWSQDELESAADRKIRYDDFAAQPRIIRGAVVEVHGQLLRLVPTAMDRAQSGFSAVYEGEILDRDQHVYSFVLTETPSAEFLPGQVSLANHVAVKLSGFFLQVLAHRSKEGDLFASPLIIGKSLVKVTASSTSGRTWDWVGVALLTAVAFMMLVTLLRLTRRRRTATRLSRQEMEEAARDLEKLALPDSRKSADGDGRDTSSEEP